MCKHEFVIHSGGEMGVIGGELVDTTFVEYVCQKCGVVADTFDELIELDTAYP